MNSAQKFRARFSGGVLAAAMATLFCCGAAHAELLFVNDQTMEGYVDGVRSNVLPRDSHGYLPPSDQQRADFRALADGLWNASSTSDLNSLVPLAQTLDYDVLSLTDAGSTYYGLQESNSVAAGKGWGSFLLRQDSSSNALVEVVHPLADINTPSVATQAFIGGEARGLLIAGAHRHANGQGTADVAHLAESVFQEVHQTFAENADNLSVWQIHGFDLDLHPEFPAGTDAVISSGTGSVTEFVLGLDQSIDNLEGDWISHVHNTLDVNDPLNIATNGDLPGSQFSSLAGRTNVQQLHTTSLGGQFVHIELEQSFRIDGGDRSRQLIAATIADSIFSTVTAVPEPNPFALLAIFSATFAAARRRT
jgi:hypothetical protein